MICEMEMELLLQPQEDVKIHQETYNLLKNGDLISAIGVKRQMEVDDEDEAALLLTKLSGHVLMGH
jgi:predicted transcriptional regulator